MKHVWNWSSGATLLAIILNNVHHGLKTHLQAVVVEMQIPAPQSQTLKSQADRCDREKQ